MHKYLYIIFYFIFITGYATAAKQELIRIDATSDSSYETSLQKIYKTLNKEKQIKLALAILKLNLAGVSGVEEAHKQNKLTNVPTDETKSKLHGLSYQGVMDLAESSNSVSFTIEGQEPGLSEEFRKPLEISTNSSLINLSGTLWVFTDNNNGHMKQKVLQFMSDGTLIYILPKQDEEWSKSHISRWQQEGNNVRISFNNDYSISLGIIESDSLMKGKSSNIYRSNWTWEAIIVTMR